MLVQPQQAATVCELDLVPHPIGSSKRAQTLDPNQPPENSHEPLKLTLDLEYAHVSGHPPALATCSDRQPVVARANHAMIRAESRSRRGPQMSATPDSTLDDPQQIIADLQRANAELHRRLEE